MNDPTTRNTGRCAAAGIALLLLASACTQDASSPSGPAYTPTFASTECPAPVVKSATRETQCGYLRVPEDRSNPSGRQIRLFIVRLEPNKPTTAPPVVYLADDLGIALDYAGLVSVADHLDGPELIGVESRGVGYSEPNLSCPEVDAVAPQAITTRVGDPGVHRTFVTAVRSCYDRFVAQGIDLSSYGVEEAGADVVDLVTALGLTTWDVITKGSSSRIVFQAMRMNAPGLRAYVAYNPEFPETDAFAQAIEATRAAVAELATLCDANGTCARRFPELAATFDEAISRFDTDPHTVRVKGKNIVVDGTRLVRDFRTLFGDIRADDPMYRHLPATIDDLAHAKDPASSLAAVVSVELSAQPFCTGYLPVCTTALSQGAYYSALCADVAPFVDVTALAALAGEGTAWSKAYQNSPYRDVCEAWRVTSADESVAAAVESDVPMLVFSGGLNPYVAPAAVRDGIKGLPNAFLVVSPMRSHQVVTIPACPNANPRNEFLADPTSAPDTSCELGFQPGFASSPLKPIL